MRNQIAMQQLKGVRGGVSARGHVMVAVTALALIGVSMSGGCRLFNKKNKPQVRARTVTPSVVRDVPDVLRGTIGAEASISGVQPLLVSGIGFVVGLNGTGGLPMPEEYAATIEREMSLNGISIANDVDGPLKGRTPRQLISDTNTAVVIVQGAVPPGAREGSSFDVFVRAVNATSLEGGKLWTTELRPGPPSNFGGPQTLRIGEAKGPIFINPFANPGDEFSTVTRDVGRILDGGIVTEDMQVEILLDNPSHDRARRIASAINSRFPERPGDGEPAARGKNDTRIRVTIPRRYQDRPDEFLALIEHLQIDRSYPEVHARRYAGEMRNQPYLANDLGWCLEALGERAKPFVRELYDFPEAAPRLAALRAGVGLDDPRAAPYLIELAESGPSILRLDAIELLARLDAGPRIDESLKGLMASKELTIRVAAYEALVDRAIRDQKRRLLAMVEGETGPGGVHLTRSGLDALAQMSLPQGTIQGVSRELVAGKFFLDRAPYGDPMLYVTQQGEPRIVLFGDVVEMQRPLLVSAWGNRLMLASDSESDPIRLYYRDLRSGRVVTQQVDGRLDKLLELMAHDQTADDPRPGLGLSYAECVGALHQLFEDKAVAATFTTERNKLIADLIRSTKQEEITLRPERAGEEAELVVFDSPRVSDGDKPRTTARREGLLVPLTPPPAEEEKKDAKDGSGGAGGE
ncbi:MAG: flagellar basal body P-ring protein FlgI [Phycisphaerales bacterium]